MSRLDRRKEGARRPPEEGPREAWSRRLVQRMRPLLHLAGGAGHRGVSFVRLHRPLLLAALGVVFAALVVWNLIVPAYTSPDSKVFTSSYGYLALLRTFDRPIPVTVGKVERGTVEDVFIGNGFLDGAINEIGLIAVANGKVRRVLVDVGMRVMEGQVLMELESEAHRVAVEIARNDYIEKEAFYRQALQNAKLDSKAMGIDVRIARNKLLEQGSLLKQARQNLARDERLYHEGVIFLATLEASRANYSKINTQYLNAKEGLERTEVLQEQGSRQISPIIGIDNARSSLLNAKAKLSKARLDYEQATRVVAPISGLVTYRGANPGESVASGRSKLVTIVGELLFRAFIDEAYTGRIEMGNEAQIRINSFPGKQWTGTVTRINPMIRTNEASFFNNAQLPRTFNVWLKLRGKRAELVPGLLGYAEFRKQRAVLLAPAGSVLNFSGGEGLAFVADGESPKTANVRRISYGVTTNGKVEIRDGLSEEDVIVVSPVQGLRDKDPIRIVNGYGD